jgi:hypothetical protein
MQEKVFDKIHHAFMIKSPEKTRIEGTCLIIKTIEQTLGISSYVVPRGHC